MRRWLVLYEGRGWRDLRPLTERTPVPALAFGGSRLAERWARYTGLPLLAVIARPEAMSAWIDPPALAGARPDAEDLVLAVDAAVLPDLWVRRVIDSGASVRLERDGLAIGIQATHSKLAAALSRGSEVESLVTRLDLDPLSVEARVLSRPWKLIEWNAAAIDEDLRTLTAGIEGEVHPLAALLEPSRVSVAGGARVDPFAVLDGRCGPIRIESGAIVFSHSMIVGPCVIGAGTQVLGGVVSRSTVGPQCRIAGEVEECVWQGYANKRHHGFVGHSVIGEWTNLGALTTTSDLKNNYGSVRVRVDGRDEDSGASKVGSFIGDHVKTGIGTLLPTGATVGLGSNLFGGGRFAPKHVPAFSWWNGETFDEHRLEPFLETARLAMSRRGRALTAADEAVLRACFAATAGERSAGSGRVEGAVR